MLCSFTWSACSYLCADLTQTFLCDLLYKCQICANKSPMFKLKKWTQHQRQFSYYVPFWKVCDLVLWYFSLFLVTQCCIIYSVFYCFYAVFCFEDIHSLHCNEALFLFFCFILLWKWPNDLGHVCWFNIFYHTIHTCPVLSESCNLREESRMALSVGWNLRLTC